MLEETLITFKHNNINVNRITIKTYMSWLTRKKKYHNCPYPVPKYELTKSSIIIIIIIIIITMLWMRCSHYQQTGSYQMCPYFSLKQWNPAPRSLHRAKVGSVANVSKVHANSIFRVEVSTVSECSCICRFRSTDHGGEGTSADPWQWVQWTGTHTETSATLLTSLKCTFSCSNFPVHCPH
jgi:hypothetical protein